MLTTVESQGASPPISKVHQRPLGQIVQDGRLLIGPVFANRILREGLYAGQRKPSPLHVEDLAEAMRRGRFDRGSQLLFGRIGANVFLINGQHRMLAIVASGQECEFVITVENCDDEDALRALYYRQDRLAVRRTDAQVLLCVGVAEKNGLQANIASAAFKAFPLIQSRFGDSRKNNELRRFRSDDARLSFGNDWWACASEYQRLIRKAPVGVKVKLLNTQIVAVALVTIKHQPVVAEQFWSGIADNDGLRKGDPRATLLYDLTYKNRGGSVRELAAAAALAWNAYFERRSLSALRASEDTPIKILGTPFTGKPL